MNKRALQHLSADPVMAKLIEKVGPVRLEPRRLPPFESLVHAIVHQQLSGKAAASIMARFQALFGDGTFPSPEMVMAKTLEELRAAGLSRPKAAYIRGVAERAVAKFVPSLIECEGMAEGALVERLTSLKGVGRWTVDMLLIFNLGRPDVLPIHDLGVRRGYQLAYRKRKLPEPEHLQQAGQRWSPFRSTAAIYLWRAADFLQDGQW